MNLTELLKLDLPSFPIADKSQLEALQKKWQDELSRLSRCSRLDSKGLTLEDQTKLNDLQSGINNYLTKIIDKASHQAENILVLMSTCEEIDAALRLHAWADYLFDVLRYTDNPLMLLVLMDTGTSLQFAGLLLCLLRKNVAIDDIINSGLLHHFFTLNSFMIDEVVAAYDILSSRVKEDELCFERTRDLLSRASSLSSSRSDSNSLALESFALNGRLVTSLLPKITIVPPSIGLSNSMENYSNLYSYYGQDFFILVLIQFSYNHYDYLKAFILHVLSKLSHADLEDLYIFINKSEEHRSLIFTELGSLISDERLISMLGSDLSWIILQSKPTLLQALPESQLISILSTPLTQQNFKYAEAMLRDNPILHKFKDIIYRHIFDLFLAEPELVIDDHPSIIYAMKANEEINLRCFSEIKTLHDELTVQVLSNIDPFTAESYNRIYDTYRMNQSRSNFLNSVSRQKLEYPYGNYRLQSFILHKLINHDYSLNLMSCLDAFHPADRYSSYTAADLKIAKLKTLYYCLITEDHPLLRYLIIKTLINDFAQDNWYNFLLDGMTIIEHSLSHGNQFIFSALISAIPKDKQLEILLGKDRSGNILLFRIPQVQLHSVLHSLNDDLLIELIRLALTDRGSIQDSLIFILGYINSRKLVNFLITKNKDDNTGLDLAISKPESLLAILRKLTPYDYHKVLKHRDNDGNTLLHRVVSNPELLRTLLAIIPEHERYSHVKDPHWYSYPILLNTSVSNTESFQMILDLHPVKERHVLAKNKYLLERATSNPECLYILLQLRPENERLELITQSDYLIEYPILFNIRKQPDVMVRVLGILRESERLIVLKKSYGDYSLFHEIIKTKPPLLDEIVRLCSKKSILDLLISDDRRELYLVASHPEALAKIMAIFDNNEARINAINFTVLRFASHNPTSLRMLLELYPLEKRFSIMTERDSNRTLIADCILTHESLKVMFDLLPIERHFEAIKENDDNHYTVLNAAVKNKEFLEQIFALYPPDQRFKAACRVAINAVQDNTLRSILNLLTPHEQIMLAKRNRLLHYIGKRTELLPVILSLYPEVEQLDALKERDRNGHTVIFNARFHPETLRNLLLYYPAEERLNALKEQCDGRMVIYHLHKHERSVNAILPLLTPTEQLQCAVMLAQIKYEEWYNNLWEEGDFLLHREQRMFSWIRHGSYGQAHAKRIMLDITSTTDEDTINNKLIDFVMDRNTRYHLHSFVTFLLSELENVGGIWAGLREENNSSLNAYKKLTVSSILNSRLTPALDHTLAPRI